MGEALADSLLSCFCRGEQRQRLQTSPPAVQVRPKDPNTLQPSPVEKNIIKRDAGLGGIRRNIKMPRKDRYNQGPNIDFSNNFFLFNN